ncbi:MAG: metallophosphoesterase family protein [Leadbetterella sp.]|nr:metallophosphoesterase family protein [Leadbetterella sp.]
MTLEREGRILKDLKLKDAYGLTDMRHEPKGVENGIELDFKLPNLDGSIAYGHIMENRPYPVIDYVAKRVPIKGGKAVLDIKTNMGGNNDFYLVARSGKGLIGYRVMNSEGIAIYEGRVAFEGKGPYKVVPTIVEGPNINVLTETGCIISYDTHVSIKTALEVNGKVIEDAAPSMHHELEVKGLKPNTVYQYTIKYGNRTFTNSFRTALPAGSQAPFTFGYVSATRSSNGNGDAPNLFVNSESLQKIMAVGAFHKMAYLQTAGDITMGNNASADGHLLDYSNWKKAVEPWRHSIPVYTAMGNHENVYRTFYDSTAKKMVRFANFPYSEGSEATHAKAFVNPANGPVSEDGAIYDPNPNEMDFPGYKETVYSYTYGNTAMIVLNTAYWMGNDAHLSVQREGYIMDNQLAWLDQTVAKYEKDKSIDHIFVALHSSVFPNGDHLEDGIWYNGDNTVRAKVAGKPLKQGILERRDEVLNILVNKSQKFLAFLTGDEHNFAVTEITPDFPIYPAGYNLSKLKLSRKVYQIHNGAGGSSSYALGNGSKGRAQWEDRVQHFAEPPVIALFDI